MTCSIPAALIRDSRWVRNGTPAVGSIGFGADRVSGRSRVPSPPTRITASTSVMATLLHTRRTGGRRLCGGAQVEPGGAHAERAREVGSGHRDLRREAMGVHALDVAGD